jgi:hypothetical protein
MATDSESNPYVRRSRLTKSKFLKTLELFLDGKSAALISNKVGMDRNTANTYAHALRVRIAKYCESTYRPLSFSEMPVATSFKNTKSHPRFSDWQVVEKRKRTNKTGKKILNNGKPVLIKGLKRKPSHFAIKVLADGKVWTAIIPKWDDFNYLYRAEKYLSRSGTWKQWLTFDAIGAYGQEKELVILNEAVAPEVRSFWFELRANLKKRRGTNDLNFYFHLKESEFRHNTEEDAPADIIASELLQQPLSLIAPMLRIKR